MSEGAAQWRFHKDGSRLPAEPEWVFVFGSNLDGRHGKGAALAARNEYGAKYGVAKGLQGRSYAIPTKGHQIASADKRIVFAELGLAEIWGNVQVFLEDARAMPERMFMVTRIACGLAGRPDALIAPMFLKAPGNCSFAEEWRHVLLRSRRGSTQ